MPARLATICLTMTLLVGISSPPVRAADDEFARATLKDISAIFVVIETLDDDAKALGLTVESIRTDVELKLRLAGIRVVTEQESFTLPGSPYLYINVNVSDRTAVAANVDVRLHQRVLLERNGARAMAPTWSKASISAHPTVQYVRDTIKDNVDAFLNAWLSVNPKK